MLMLCDPLEFGVESIIAMVTANKPYTAVTVATNIVTSILYGVLYCYQQL